MRMMKNRDEKMRLRYQEKEETRLLNKIDKQIRKEKAEFYARTDKDKQEDAAFQQLLELKKRLEG